MKRCIVGLLILCVGVGLLGGAGLSYQMTPEEVKAAAGTPVSLLEREDRAIWMYPDGGRVEFAEGRAVIITNMLMATEAEIIAAEESAAEAEKLAAAEAERVAAATDAAQQAEAAKREAEMAEAHAEAMAAISNSIEELEAQYDGGMPDLGLGPPPASQFWIALLVQSFIGVFITMLALKLAFKWSDVHADWGQMFLPAMVDMFAGTIIRGGGYALLKTDQFYHIDDGVSFFALLITLKLATHASTLQRAVAVAVAAKLASIVVWTVLSVFLLQALFG
ncbi:MAG: hypothetical protein HOH58_01965 [Opitutaceae bacterium]|jgi:hypothetical protein|nr:hypothetical protein [Opitutaceae bacterium]